MKKSLRITITVLDENGVEHEQMAVLAHGPLVAAPIRMMVDRLIAELKKIGIKETE